MINITIAAGHNGRPAVLITDHATGAELTKTFPLYRSRMTGRWGGKGMAYQTPEDRQNLLNEARQFADGFAKGIEYARSQISRVNDQQPAVTYQPDDPSFVRQHEESLRRAAQS